MKNSLFTIGGLLLLVHSIFAQHSLLRSEMLKFGSKINYKYTNDFSAIDTTIKIIGNNVTWDFSSLKNNGTSNDLLITMTDPSNTPYSSVFPTASYTYLEEQDGETNYRFFSLTDNKMERVGTYVSSKKTYNDPQVEYVFPLTLGTKNSDTWDNDHSSFGGTYDFECIGSGTLITPGGTFDALMVHVIVTEFFDTEAYFWYSADHGGLLFQYIIGDGFFTGTSAMYADKITIQSTTNIEKMSFLNDLSYNNPVTNNLMINFNTTYSNYMYTVTNSIGEIVLQEVSNDEELETLNIDFNDYPTGIYFVRFINQNSTKSSKTLKVIKK